jgi:uncharacterized protein YqgC (DUF456 family)
MNKNIIQAIRIFFGVLLIVVGVAGIILPVLPGWILIFIGIELIGIQLVFLQNIKEYIKKKLAETKKTK